MAMNHTEYKSERERVWKEILSDLEVDGSKVIDVGIGESTEKLAEAGAQVIGIDSEIEKLKECEVDVPLVKCNIVNFPFEKRIADLTLFNFTLHEINPHQHSEAIRMASLISPRLAVIEPSPEGGPLYQRYKKLQQEIMESIGKYEEYRPLSYWKDLVRKEGFEITTAKTIKPQTVIPPSILEDIKQDTIETLKEKGVKKEYTQDMKEILEDAKEQGMRWSPRLVVIGEHP